MFICKELGVYPFLSPAIQTKAIQKLSKYMTEYHNTERYSEVKSTCVICFDISGTGKTTTIMEATRNCNGLFAHINLNDNQLFRPLLNSCKRLGEKQNPPLKSADFIDYATVVEHFEKRFQTVLSLLFQSIMEQLGTLDSSNLGQNGGNINVVLPKYTSPSSAEFPDLDKCLVDNYYELVQKIQKLNRLLVIHLDDCQLFFCGLTKNAILQDGKIKVGEIMSAAFRLFSKEVLNFTKCKDILWVFSGTRPNLSLEIKIASTYEEQYDVAKSLQDFNADDVTTVLGQYFDLKDMSAELKQKMEHLAGPPKLLYWFIISALETDLSSISDFEEKWDKIEDMAVGIYKDRIFSTIQSFGLPIEELERYSRNLVLLHTSTLINERGGNLTFKRLPSNWLPFIEGGMIRIRKEGTSWKLFQPNRFLIKIFNEYIEWFTWENIQDLVANIKASATTKSLKGKVFEYLFALELLAPADSLLWTRLGELMKIKPKANWVPKIRQIDNINTALDQGAVYVMIDPARDKSKTDVVFFAETVESETPVRVLCQLTTQVKDSTDKAKNSFNAMFKLVNDTIPDYRLFLAPKSTVDFPQIHQKQFSDANCFWVDSRSFDSMLSFTLDLCDPNKTEKALIELMEFAGSNNKELADRVRMSVSGTPKKRKREFQSMDEFYDALKGISDWEEEDTEIVKEVFITQRIKLNQLSTLTDGKLKEYGLKQGGLREAVLSVIENR